MARRQQNQQSQQQLRINRQTPARRCEVCHQSDEFDPTRNTCSRCANVEPIDQEIIVLTDEEDEEIAQEPQVLNLAELAATFATTMAPTTSTPTTASTAALNADDRRHQLILN